ncbi:hypothetical protein OSB04_021477 [Centaurea solstitialis]|uniref:BHLH domain-containing protein n=1 Tax=Centaurea solstitialis TaxID=347529 RepID=A0AA38SVW7_9ASTR|nr:hypothetical protein OSB04_021477 [Centaurea solstitialis]
MVVCGSDWWVVVVNGGSDGVKFATCSIICRRKYKGGVIVAPADTSSTSYQDTRMNRVTDKIRALRALVPNCNKVMPLGLSRNQATSEFYFVFVRDQASILDDAIEYIKFLQMLVQMMQPMGVDFMPQRPYMSLTRQLSLQVPNLAPHTFIPLSIAMQYGIPQFGSYFPTNNVIVLPSFSQFPQLAMDMRARPFPLGQTRSIIRPPLELWFPPQGSQFGNSSTRPFSHTTIHKTLSQAESTDFLGQLLCRVLVTTSQVIIEDHGLSLISVYDLSTSITRKLHISNHDFRPTLATKFSRLSIEKNYNNYRQIRAEEYPNIPLGTVTLNDVELWEHSVGGLHKGRIFGFGTTLDPRYATSGDSVASSSWSSHREEDWDALKEEVRQERIMKLKLDEQLRQEREAQLMLEEKYQSSRQRSQAQRIISDVEEVADDKVMTARDLKMDFSDSYLTTTCLTLNREFALVTR